ncbi:MAG: FtsB family cell division protein [Oscillochloridaceae bacterium umkhey_bin13]
MKSPRRHATRRLFGLPSRRTLALPSFSSDQVLTALRLSGKSALTIGLALLMMIFIGLLLTNFVGQVMQSARLEQQRAALEAEVEQIRLENAQIEGAVNFTESAVYVERVAREQLGYAKPGDIVILPRMAEPTPAPVNEEAPPLPVTPEAQGPRVPNWQRWWQALFPVTANASLAPRYNE